MGDASRFFNGGPPSSPPSVVKPLNAPALDLSGVASIAGFWTNSGVLTAATYKDVITLTGRGVLNLAAVKANDATSRTVHIKLTIDGTTVVEATGTTATTHYGFVPVGFVSPAGAAVSLDQVPFETSCVVAIKSSITETDKLAFASAYRTC